MSPEILLYTIKLVLGGIVAFLAIFVMSKTRDASWMFLVTGFLFLYASIVYDLMLTLGIVAEPTLTIFGIPISSFLTAIIPNFFFILSFIIKLFKK